MVQWSILCASNTGGVGSIPGRATKIPHAAWKQKQKQNQKQNGGDVGRMKRISKMELWICSQRPNGEEQKSSNRVNHFGRGRSPKGWEGWPRSLCLALLTHP